MAGSLLAGLAQSLGGAALRVGDELHHLRAVVGAGLLAPAPPHKLAAIARAISRYGPLGGGITAAAIRNPDAAGVTDELGSLTFTELDRRSNALSTALIAHGVGAGDGVALLARNHRGFLDATFAVSKAGARLILLNTDFAGPQIREVCEREGARLLIHDDEYTELLSGYEPELGTLRAWTDRPGDDTLEALIEAGDPAPPPAPSEESRVIILTSGTTGTPKGAPRETPKSLAPVGVLLDCVPIRAEEATVVGAPMFHALGFAHMALAVGMASTSVVRRRFDPVGMLEDIERTGATGVVLVPVMLSRLLDTIAEGAAADTSSLRWVFVGGSQLTGPLATRALDALGDKIYNLYGSTEVSYVSIAGPEHLRLAPDTVGPICRGVQVKILDEAGREQATGHTGRIFVGNAMAFEGYTGGGTKEMIDGLMSTGDVGHLDANGLLFVDGRDDEMIVSGGENVFPREVEELLGGLEQVDEVACIGVEDEQFGKRLKAFVVLREGAKLSEAEVKDHVKSSLARYKVPREVEFIDELPRNPSGKILKRELS